MKPKQDHNKSLATLKPRGEDPLRLFREWLDLALREEGEQAYAMCLSTVSLAGDPSARIVLLKAADEKGLVFFTNYDSRKGEEIRAHPVVALTFHWKGLERQVRIRGRARKTSAVESTAYFNSRPFESRVSAAISPQSLEIPGRQYLETLRKNYLALIGDTEPGRPSHWGGFVVVPTYFEFWQGRENRLHDRLFFRKSRGKWTSGFLAP